MPHVTFIHGILNKPPEAELLNTWRNSLAFDNGLNLSAEGVTSTMVYWADVLYPSPESSAANESAAVVAPDLSRLPDDAWKYQLEGQEKDLMQSLQAKLDAQIVSLDQPGHSLTDQPTVELPPGLERVPLPWAVKKFVLEQFLRDVHHYLFNVTFNPRPGVSFHVRDEIRRRFLEKIQLGAGKTPPHVVVSHSMGTVIAYDCLARVPECKAVDGLITLGSPLGLDEVRDLLQPGWNPGSAITPGWSPVDAFPTSRLKGDWANVFDLLDPVCGFAPHLAALYMKAGSQVIRDHRVENREQAWKHDLSLYFHRQPLRNELKALLNLD